MTADYVAFHAIERPEAIAFVDNGRRFTYAQFDRDIRKFIPALRELGLGRGSRVGLGCSDLYLTWTLLLALERLAVTTLMLNRQEPPEARPLLASLDMALSEWGLAPGAVKRHHALTPDWVEAVRARPETDGGDLPKRSDDDTIFILRTTGTTGDPKVLHGVRRTQAAWADDWIWQQGLTNASRFLLVLTLDVYTIYTLATGVIRAGGTVVREDRVQLGQAIWDHGITHVALFPIHLGSLMDALPEGYPKPRSLTVTSFGATLSEALREKTTARFATVLYDNYGSREAGFVSRILAANSGGIGTLSPLAQAVVLDEQGRSLPPGELGRLWIKTPFMHREYAGNPEATAKSFRDGWFNSGDLAILHGRRGVQLMGRADDLLNIGGTKMPPSVIEELILRTVNAKDAGVCSIRNQLGIEELLIGVADAPIGAQELRERIGAALRPLQFATIRLARISPIPRNAGGKIQRDQLQRILARLAGLT
ncbi:MAG TPA: class I adenylate-forming enzyme family protein [Stellaceae bacterium]|nr:class I adenylate-forming enzyme family protein [Stellaceae bacterium]